MLKPLEQDLTTYWTGHYKPSLDNAYFYMYIFTMDFTWHETKRKTNLKKHGLDFADADQVFSGPTVTVDDEVYGDEQRYNTTGLLGVKVVVITHTETESEIRVISMREAEQYEIKKFFSYL